MPKDTPAKPLEAISNGPELVAALKQLDEKHQVELLRIFQRKISSFRSHRVFVDFWKQVDYSQCMEIIGIFISK